VKLAVGLSYFNNVKEIPRLLDPIVKHVDLVIGVDGRYPLFKWPENLSTDGSTELLIEKYNAVVQVNKSPVEQIDKRNQYLEIADKAGMDFCLVLDSDDYLHPEYQDWTTFKKQLEKLEGNLANMWSWISPLWIKNHNKVKNNTWKQYTRLIRPDKVRYDITHWTFTPRDNPVVFESAKETVDGIRITSDSTLRSKKYIKAGYSWAKQQILQENDRFDSPRAKRLNRNMAWIEIKKILKMPNTTVLVDNTEDQLTKLK
jgi:glycosyltransferase involved in cell wall biosynthesis